MGLVIAMAIAATIVRFLLEAHAGFSLWDEGYLWYGVQSVLLGEVPIRDFGSYDPGRYYWAAILLRIFHAQGIVAVRAATFAFATIGLACAGWLVLNGTRGNMTARMGLCALAIALCVLWMVPWWKAYDAAISLVLVVSLARVLMRASPVRFLQHGVVVGLVAVFGRNHGLYGALASLLAAPLLILSTQQPRWLRCIPAWLVGVVLGYMPILIGFVLDKRFAAAFWDGVYYILFEFKSTNLPLPVPWPWTIPFGQAPWPVTVRSWLIGGCFVGLLIFCVLCSAKLIRGVRHERRILHPVFAACVATAVPYLNVAFSRAEVGHLAQAILPALIGLLVFPLTRPGKVVMRWLGLPLLVTVTLCVMLPLHPGYLMRSQSNWAPIDLRGDTVWMDSSVAATVSDVKTLAKAHAPNGGAVLAAPVWPSVYALLGVRSPVWDIYPLTPRNSAFERQEITRLQQAAPQLVLIDDIAVDGQDQLRYSHTHPLLWQYINKHYRQIPGPAREPQLKVYVP